MRAKGFLLLTLLILVLFCFGCGTTTMRINVKRPAEINLKNYNKIAVGDITDEYGRKSRHSKDVADSITTTLFESKHFDVLDRQHLQAVIEEHKLNFSGIIDESTAGELGKIIGAAALVFGRIQTDDYKEERTSSDGYTDKDGNYHKKYYRNGVYTLLVNIKVIDIQTAKVLAVKTLAASYKDKTSADNKTPPKINASALYTSCINNIKRQFLKMVAPYVVSVNATFQTDSKLPEIDNAIIQFKIGEWDEGMKLLEETTKKPGLEPKVLAKVYYDLGLAQMYRGEFENSKQNLKKALSINPGSTVYQKALIQLKAEKKNAEKLKEQI